MILDGKTILNLLKNNYFDYKYNKSLIVFYNE